MWAYKSVCIWGHPELIGLAKCTKASVGGKLFVTTVTVFLFVFHLHHSKYCFVFRDYFTFTVVNFITLYYRLWCRYRSRLCRLWYRTRRLSDAVVVVFASVVNLSTILANTVLCKPVDDSDTVVRSKHIMVFSTTSVVSAAVCKTNTQVLQTNSLVLVIDWLTTVSHSELAYDNNVKRWVWLSPPVCHTGGGDSKARLLTLQFATRSTGSCGKASWVNLAPELLMFYFECFF